MLLSIILILSTQTVQAAELEGNVKCTGQYRKVDVSGKVTEVEKPLVVVGKWPGVAKHELSLEGRYFSLNEDLDSGDLLGFIVREDDTTRGKVTKAGLDSTGRYSITEVAGEVIYKLVCKGQRADKPVRQGF